MRWISVVCIAALAVVAPEAAGKTLGKDDLRLVFCCREDNDLYQAALSLGHNWLRFDSPAEAIRYAPEGAGVLLLADGYPLDTLELPEDVLDKAVAKRQRLYIEYPAKLTGLQIGPPREAKGERVVVVSNRFAPAVEKMRILGINECNFVPVDASETYLALARVAGFDTPAFGLPPSVPTNNPDCQVFPLLFKHPLCDTLVATTKLSQFISGRYGPTEAWKAIWKNILEWLRGEPIPRFEWTPLVRPSYGPRDLLPATAELEALTRGAQWYFNAKLIVHPSWKDKIDALGLDKDRVGQGPSLDWPVGDGRAGLLEGFSSKIYFDGRQAMRYWMRNDCMSESAMALAFYGAVKDDARGRDVGANLQDFIYVISDLTKGPRSDPESPSYGLVGWDNDGHADVYYGDDNARSMLGTMATAALTKNDRWNEALLRCLLANLRTTGTLGFRGNCLTEDGLKQNGWRHYFEASPVNCAPHYEAYLWACYLWAYKHTEYAPFFERAKKAIQKTMEAYPNDWQWTNGIQQERARMLLPLAWLVRVEDTAEHRQWLRKMADDLLALQEPTGALREQLGPEGKGTIPPPKSNEEYGKKESPVIQQNGDPACDLLYTTNFAFIGLHEAAAATGEAVYGDAEKALAAFLCRIQVAALSPIAQSNTADAPPEAQKRIADFFDLRLLARPELDGAWFRAFDFGKWDYWGSNSDCGWGAWCTESGWTQGWITSTLALRQMKTSLWELTLDVDVKKHLAALEPAMLPKGSE